MLSSLSARERERHRDEGATSRQGEQPSERTWQTAKGGGVAMGGSKEARQHRRSGTWTKGLAWHEVYKMYVTVARLPLEVCVKLCCCCLCCCCCCCCRRCCCCCCSTSTYCLPSFSQRCLCSWHKMLKDTPTHTPSADTHTRKHTRTHTLWKLMLSLCSISLFLVDLFGH